MKVRVHHNGDDVFIAWKPAGFIPDCRGFALLRRRNGVEEVVSTWVGFVDDRAVCSALLQTDGSLETRMLRLLGE